MRVSKVVQISDVLVVHQKFRIAKTGPVLVRCGSFWFWSVLDKVKFSVGFTSRDASFISKFGHFMYVQ